MRLSSNRGAAAPCYPCLAPSAFRPPARSGEDASHRLLQPTHDTSTRKPPDSRAGQFSLTTTGATHLSLRRRRTRLSARSTPGGGALDGALPTSAGPFTAPFRVQAQNLGRLAAAFSTACEGEGRPLTFPFALPRELCLAEIAGALGSLPLPVRQREQLPRPGTPSIVRCRTGALSHDPFNPPPSRGFATGEPASDALSLLVALARGARPEGRWLFAKDPLGQTPPDDFCNRDDPRARLRHRPNPAHPTRSRPHVQLSALSAFRREWPAGGWPRLLRDEPTEISRPRGRRVLRLRFRPRSLVAELYPNPFGSDTSCRGAVARGLEDPRDRASLDAPLRLRRRCFRRSPVQGPPLASPREGNRDTPHPRCLPSTDAP
jgi:hypothetical protein